MDTSTKDLIDVVAKAIRLRDSTDDFALATAAVEATRQWLRERDYVVSILFEGRIRGDPRLRSGQD